MSSASAPTPAKPTAPPIGDVFGPPAVPTTDTEVMPRAGEKRDRETSPSPAKDAPVPDRPASKSPVKKTGSPTKKRNTTLRTKLQLTAVDIETLDLQGCRVLLKTVLGELEDLKKEQKALLALIPKQPLQSAQKKPVSEDPAPTHAPAAPTPTDPVGPSRSGTEGAAAALPATRTYAAVADTQRTAWDLIRPRGRPQSGATLTGTATPSSTDQLGTVYIKLHRTPMRQLRGALQVLFIPTSLILDYAFVRENTLQVMVKMESRDRLERAFRSAGIEIYDSYDPLRPASASASAEEQTYAWDRFVRVVDSGIAHGRAMGRVAVVGFYEEWKAREEARRAGPVTAAPIPGDKTILTRQSQDADASMQEEASLQC
ncbi:hypothetical protein CF319_g8437 [Tilletia indica]|nr:hypothetical protein CF319_g8437 [Tilletia indica]